MLRERDAVKSERMPGNDLHLYLGLAEQAGLDLECTGCGHQCSSLAPLMGFQMTTHRDTGAIHPARVTSQAHKQA